MKILTIMPTINNSKKLRVFLVLSLVLGLHVDCKAQLSPELESKLSEALIAEQARYNLKGVQAAVSIGTQNPWQGAAGVSSAFEPLQSEMLIGIASGTKTYVSMVFLKMSERGLISLDDTIGKWLNEFDNIPKSITIRRLLNHTSGIPDYLTNDSYRDLFNNISKLWTKEELIEKYIPMPTADPSTAFSYSNTNYVLLGILAERIQELPIHAIIRNEILTPLSLRKTFMPPFNTYEQPHANLWSFLGSDPYLKDLGDFSETSILPRNSGSFGQSDGFIFCTAGDNVRFWQGLFNGLISKKSLNHEMLQFTPGSNYGLGVERSNAFGNVTYGHNGSWFGQVSSSLVDTTKKIYISILTNQDSLTSQVGNVVRSLYKTVLDNYALASAPSTLFKSPLKLSPNPANNELTLSGNSNAIAAIKIINALGQQVFVSKNKSTQGPFTLDISNLESGIKYVYVTYTDGNVQHLKFIKL
jgi:CubicO group peptidase (beta-lactamase class C family)